MDADENKNIYHILFLTRIQYTLRSTYTAFPFSSCHVLYQCHILRIGFYSYDCFYTALVYYSFCDGPAPRQPSLRLTQRPQRTPH